MKDLKIKNVKKTSTLIENRQIIIECDQLVNWGSTIPNPNQNGRIYPHGLLGKEFKRMYLGEWVGGELTHGKK